MYGTLFDCEDSPEAPTESGNCALGTKDTKVLTPPNAGPDLPITELGGITTALAANVCTSSEVVLKCPDFDALTYTGFGTFPAGGDICSVTWDDEDILELPQASAACDATCIEGG